MLARKCGANIEEVVLGLVLHDIGWTADKTGREHAVCGVPIATRILLQVGYDRDMVARIGGIILSHSCRGIIPDTREEKVVATADALSKFSKDFVIWSLLNNRPQLDTAGRAKSVLEMLDRALAEQFFFQEERRKAQEKYEALKVIFGANG